MHRAHRPAVKAVAVARCLPSLAELLAALAQEVGKGLAREVKALTARNFKGWKKHPAGNAVNLDELGARLTVLVADVLNESLTSPTEASKALRMALIAGLASAESGQCPAIALPQTAVGNADALLTTAEAAAQLEVSRPYVSMLCDAGKLGEVAMTEGGHRRIRSSAVDAYLKGRTRRHVTAPSPRAAGVEAGLYDHPDEYFTNAVRGAPAAPARAEDAPVKPARKSRS